MILNRGINNIGCVNEVFHKTQNISFPFPSAVFYGLFLEKVLFDISLGIKVSCFSLPGNFCFPDFEKDNEIPVLSLNELKDKIRGNHRIIFYLPSYFFLGSQKEEVVYQTLDELRKISNFLEIIGVSSRSICIKVGTAYANRKQTLKRFSSVVNSLSDGIKSRITVCNDEKPSLFSVTDLLSGVYYDCRIPITFRSLPHSFNSGGLTFREALFLGVSTWDSDQVPIMIHSESKEIDTNGLPVSKEPSEFLSHRIPTFSLNLDCVIDSPQSEICCVEYMRQYLSLKPKVISKISSK